MLKVCRTGLDFGERKPFGGAFLLLGFGWLLFSQRHVYHSWYGERGGCDIILIQL